jgi:hypothetical protein
VLRGEKDFFQVYPWVQMILVLQGQMKNVTSFGGGLVTTPTIAFVRDSTIQEHDETTIEFHVSCSLSSFDLCVILSEHI